MAYIFTISLLGVFFLGFPVRMLMKRFDIVHKSNKAIKQVSNRTVPYGGGISIGLVVISMLWYLFFYGSLSTLVDGHQLTGITIAIFTLLVGGVLDDIWDLPARWQIVFPVLAAITTIAGGIRFDTLTNPAGGIISLKHSLLIADAVIFVWLLTMMMTTKVLDGLDGLVTGITAIGAIIMFFLVRQPQWFDLQAQTVSVVVAGALVGFLLWNTHPAKMFLGQGGSLLAGYFLALLAILSGSKVMITVLVLGVPLLDLLRVVIIRSARGKSILTGDNEHLHYRLMESGLSHRQTVFLLYAIALLFGMSALFLQNKQQLMALLFLFVLMLLVAMWFERQRK